MADLDLLNDFWRETEKEKHLACYTRTLRRARPYTLDDDAVELITVLASGPTINEKLGLYRSLARLPFDTIWIELNYNARYNARVNLGTSEGEKPKDTPDRMGWLMERVSETVWRATTIIRYTPDGLSAVEERDRHTIIPRDFSGRQVDTYAVTHVVSTEGKLQFHSFARDPVLRQAVMEMNEPNEKYPNGEDSGCSIVQAVAWGFGEVSPTGKRLIGLPSHLIGANAVDLPPSYEMILERVSKGVPSVKRERLKKHMLEGSVELQGDLRFLCAALATINEVPTVINEVRQPGNMRVGGAMKPFMINRVVSIGIPKTRGRVRKVMGMLRLAEKRMRAHEVGGHWKTVYSGPGRTVAERRWINDYQRGDASLGFVRQEREVKQK